MSKKTVGRRALFLWQLRAGLVGFVLCFFLTLFFSDFAFWYPLLLAVVGVGVLFFLCVYYPLKKVKFSFFIHDGQFVLDSGVFYNRRRVIPLENIQYITTMQSPDMMVFGLMSAVIHSVGTTLYLSCIEKEDALNLQEYCARRRKR